MLTTHLLQRLQTELDESRDAVIQLAGDIYRDPELSGHEERAKSRCEELLRRHGFAIEPVPDVPTAFIATLEGSRPGPTVGFLAEYDALPEIGHACGHHLIAGSAVGAGLTLASLMHDLPGRIRVFGCPAEETLIGKIEMLRAGAFAALDYALTFHAHDRTSLMTSSTGLRVQTFTFHGAPAHAGSDPWAGTSALDGVLLTFQNVNALRQLVRDGVRIHGIVTDGGQAFNIVPERAACVIGVRANDPDELDRVSSRVAECARAAAIASATELHIEVGADTAPVRMDPQLAGRMRRALTALGQTVEEWPALAATDFGNVSEVVPSLLFSVETSPRGTVFHTREAEAAAGDPAALEAMLTGALAMAVVGAELLSSEDLSHEEEAE